MSWKLKWALGSIAMNKASGGDGIPVELFQILKDDAVKVLHSICQQIWKTQQWPWDWKRFVFISIPKKGNAKECSRSDQIRSVTESCLTLCDPMNRSTPGLPVHHQLLEFTQTHVHRVSNAIQPSHPLSSPSPLAPIPPSIRVFSNESTLWTRWPKYWSFSFSIIPSKEIPGLISFRMDWLDLLAVQGTQMTLNVGFGGLGS